jgi:hypothetical protein
MLNVQIGLRNKDIYYRDQHGYSSDEYLSAGVDQIPILYGRTAVDCYEDFMISFIDKFQSLMGNTIQEITIGLGPSGELRYIHLSYVHAYLSMIINLFILRCIIAQVICFWNSISLHCM